MDFSTKILEQNKAESPLFLFLPLLQLRLSTPFAILVKEVIQLSYSPKSRITWQALEIFFPRLNQDSGAQEKCIPSFATHKEIATVAVNPGTKLITGRGAQANPSV